MSEVAITQSAVSFELSNSDSTRRASPDSARTTAKEGDITLSPSFSSVPTSVAPAQASQPDPSEAVRDAIAKMNEYIQSTQRDLRFRIDPELGETIVTVVDRNTDEVVRQIPDETFLKLARSMQEQQPIHFFSEQA